jgi:hypothetical protein
LQFGHGAFRDDLALVNDQQTIAHPLGFGQDVGREQDRLLFFQA